MKREFGLLFSSSADCWFYFMAYSVNYYVFVTKGDEILNECVVRIAIVHWEFSSRRASFSLLPLNAKIWCTSSFPASFDPATFVDC